MSLPRCLLSYYTIHHESPVFALFGRTIRESPLQICAYLLHGARGVEDAFRFRNAKSSVFSRRRKTPEERLRSGRHDPYGFVGILHMAGMGDAQCRTQKSAPLRDAPF